MNAKRKQKLYYIVLLLLLVSSAVGLVLYALKQNINLFYTPSQLLSAHIQPNQVIRIGGYVQTHSVKYDASGQIVDFVVTDRSKTLNVRYQGVLPNLFREGQTVVITGTLTNNQVFNASQVLAKHDENYMPKPLAKALKEGRQHAS
jgi:cytochrome c-type biogenesis protein CcmE